MGRRNMPRTSEAHQGSRLMSNGCVKEYRYHYGSEQHNFLIFFPRTYGSIACHHLTLISCVRPHYKFIVPKDNKELLAVEYLSK